MRVFRLCNRAHSELDGIGASITGCRWNPPGVSVVYTASSSALTILEYAVHLKALPDNLLLLTIEIPSTLGTESVTHIYPNVQDSQKMGKEWIAAGQSPVLCVPSVIAPSSFNYLLNPSHQLAPAVQILHSQPFTLDSRLISGLPV